MTVDLPSPVSSCAGAVSAWKPLRRAARGSGPLDQPQAAAALQLWPAPHPCIHLQPHQPGGGASFLTARCLLAERLACVCHGCKPMHPRHTLCPRLCTPWERHTTRHSMPACLPSQRLGGTKPRVPARHLQTYDAIISQLASEQELLSFSQQRVLGQSTVPLHRPRLHASLLLSHVSGVMLALCLVGIKSPT